MSSNDSEQFTMYSHKSLWLNHRKESVNESMGMEGTGGAWGQKGSH